VGVMHEIPPPVAFEPQPVKSTGGDRLRRRLQVALIRARGIARPAGGVQAAGWLPSLAQTRGGRPRLAVVETPRAQLTEWTGSVVRFRRTRRTDRLPVPGLLDGTQIAAIGTGRMAAQYVVRARFDPPAEPVLSTQARSAAVLPPLDAGPPGVLLTTGPTAWRFGSPGRQQRIRYVARAGADVWSFIDPDVLVTAARRVRWVLRESASTGRRLSGRVVRWALSGARGVRRWPAPGVRRVSSDSIGRSSGNAR
jgi:hypothetical protein